MARRLFMLALPFFMLSATACGREAPPADVSADTEVAIPVAAQPAQRGNLKAIIRTTGMVTPAAGSEFIVTAQEPGRIVELPAAEGDLVSRGDLLVRFDVPSAVAEASRHQADITRTQALLENARVAQTRARDLVERGIISRREMENADRDVADAQADLARADAARQASDAAAARAVVRAPFAGLIAKRLHNPGDIVQGLATDPILRLVDPDRLEVTVPIPAAEAPRVLPGAVARITSIPVPIRLVVTTRPAAAPGSADATARLGFADGSPLPVDSRVDIEIEGEEHVGAVLVPLDAIVRTGTGTSVIIAAGNRAERRVVTTGLADADSIEIVSGVEPGELVITRGQAGLAEGAVISVQQSRP